MAIGSIGDLADEIRKITDESFGDFEGFPSNAAEVGQRWAEVIDVLGGSVTPPSTTGTVAKAAFGTAMIAANTPNAGIPTMIAACAAYGVTLALGQLPTFASVPPVIPAPIAPTGVTTQNAEIEAYALAAALSLWIHTGFAVNTATGVTVLWS